MAVTGAQAWGGLAAAAGGAEEFRLPQPAIRSAAGRMKTNEGLKRIMLEDGSWILLLEVAVALGLAGFIIWYTLPRRKKPEPPARTKADARSKADE